MTCPVIIKQLRRGLSIYSSIFFGSLIRKPSHKACNQMQLVAGKDKGEDLKKESSSVFRGTSQEALAGPTVPSLFSRVTT